MINLLKADLFRVLRTKIVYISFIVAFVLPLFVVGVSALSDYAVASIDPEYSSATELGTTLLFSSFSPLTSFAYIFAIFPVIVIMMDFGNGTTRNKIIHGYNRHQIFAAHFIVSLVYAFIITTIFVVTNSVSAVLMLKVGNVPSSLISTILLYYALGFLSVILIASVGCGLAMTFMNAGAIILTVVGILFFQNIGSIIELILQMNEVSNIEYYIAYLPTVVTESLSSAISSAILYNIETELNITYIIEAIIGTLAISGGFYALGTFVFNKRDLK